MLAIEGNTLLKRSPVPAPDLGIHGTADRAVFRNRHHGRSDRFFPVGNGEAIAREMPGARLLVLKETATAIPDATVG
ncbi:hypothetical protein [Streptomyces botrytidirepellens]|uniref:hypothetical protein n=1 Tax=Streptomyces botrytidirepellens TaxID=2486417 RepID=UPI001FE400C5|nr:hypothetical protein [Streptomyces botrytidirepellens]